MGKSQFQISRSLDERIKRIISGSAEADTEYSNVQSAYILGFNYGNITNCVGLTTNYQLHHAVFPVVGLVYFKECPTDEEVKSNLKSIKNYSSSPNGLGSFKSDKNEHLFLIYSVIEGAKENENIDKRIFNFSKGTYVRRKRHRLSILNDPYCPKNVYNGTEDLFNLDADGDSMSSKEDEPVDHLIFFIHGVGGVCDVRFRSCVEVVAEFKKMANTLLAQHSNPSSGSSTPTNRYLANSFRRGFFRRHSDNSSASHDSDQSETCNSSPTPTGRIRRVECLPISWHSLTRRQTGISEQLNLIALGSVPKLRHFLNKVVMDAMLYSSGPVFAQTIMNNVGNEINRLYTLFMERHPNFTGSVSLAGHSLGSVIVFDLLAHQVGNLSKSTQASGTVDNCMDEDEIMADRMNNNEQDRSDENAPKQRVNSRSQCFNISHKHHVMAKSENENCCTDYRNLQELLLDMDLVQYEELFQKEHINLDNLLLLTDFDLKELRLPLGARRQLGTYINFKKVSKLQASKTSPGMNNCSEKMNLTSKEPKESFGDIYGSMNSGQCLVEYPQLKFKPRCFFSFGSPTAMFLNVRGIQQLSGEYKLPTCDRMLNIFHPYDPLAYRFEPMIDPRFKSVEPVLIPHHRGGKRMHVQIREGFARVGQDIKHRILGSLRNTWTSFTRMGQADEVSASEIPASVAESSSSCLQKKRRLTKSVSSSGEVGERESFESCLSSFSQPSEGSRAGGASKTRQARNPLVKQESIASESVDGGIGSTSDADTSVLRKIKSMRLNSTTATTIEAASSVEETQPDDCNRGHKGDTEKPSEEEQLGQEDNNDTIDRTKIGALNCGRRIDYVLQEKPIELFNEYIFAFTSHANYWQNEDSALLILNEIYQADGVQLLDPTEY